MKLKPPLWYLINKSGSMMPNAPKTKSKPVQIVNWKVPLDFDEVL